MTRHIARALRAALPLAALAGFAACGDSVSGPERAAQRMAARFDYIGDSLSEAGAADASASAHLMAEVLRMSDRLGTVTVSVDGAPRTYHALLLQFEVPATPDEPGFGQVVVAWQGESLREGFAFLLDTTGAVAVSPPSPEGEAAAHAFGGLFEGGAVGGRVWAATAGTVASARARLVGDCGRSHAIPPSADYDCDRAVVTFRANVTLREVNDAGAPAAGPARSLLIDGQPIGGLALTVRALPEAAAARFSPRRLMPILR